MDKSVKESFDRVKEDILSLREELSNLKKGLNETREYLSDLCEITKTLAKKDPKENILSKKDTKTYAIDIPTFTTHTSTVPQEIEGLKPTNFNISTGNEGVPTD